MQPEAAGVARAAPSRPLRGCGGQHELRARTLISNKCGKIGHIAWVCRLRADATKDKHTNTEVSISGVIVASTAAVMDHLTITVEVTPQATQR